MRRCLPLILIVLAFLLLSAVSSVNAWTGRRAVLYAEAQVMLALNEPWVRGKTDCSGQMQRLLDRTFPELRATCKWFRRTTVEIMATWPWDVVMRLQDLHFGDLLFANSEKYAAPGEPGRRRSTKADFKTNHELMQWTCRETAIHAGKSKGFSETNLKPYWWPRITLAIRPPY